ncbi:MAG: co-chaperone GroES [Simkania sp.]|nr:co-chaperone GroES [Simkania sp.]
MTQQAAKKITLKPLGNRVLAKRMEQEQTLKGGIILPDTAKKKQESALIVAIGTGAKTPEGKLIPISVKVGDTILMDKYSGQEVTIDDEDFVILRSEDIIAIIE